MAGQSSTEEGLKDVVGLPCEPLSEAMPLSLPKKALITKPWQYQHVYRHGRRFCGKDLALIFTHNDLGWDRLGISVGKQKLAVQRNRIKRLVREFYRYHRDLPALVANHSVGSIGVDLVIATNQHFNPRTLNDIQACLERLAGVVLGGAVSVSHCCHN